MEKVTLPRTVLSSPVCRWDFEITEEDDEVPQLVTLDEHLSQEVETQLGPLEDGQANSVDLEEDGKKVPITILTGIIGA
jgi:hypothetical protein